MERNGVMNKLICPISDEKVNKAVVRLTGFFVAVLSFVYIFTNNPWVLVFLIIDFTIRAFSIFRFSPLSFIACSINILFTIRPIMIDKAPKLFAARVGLLFSITSLVLFFVSPVTSIAVLGVLTFFALLEALFDFCVGCVVYTYVILPLNKSNI